MAVPSSQPLSLLEVLRRSADHLGRIGVTQPRLEAELLLGQALGLSRLDLYLQFERPLLRSELAGVRELLRQRGSGRPLAYILGEKEFFGRPFAVGPGVLIPRPETELLVELAIRRAPELGPAPRALDLGCGTGCIGISLAAEVPQLLEVHAVDLEAVAVEVSRANAVRHSVVPRLQVFTGSWAAAVEGWPPYQLVVSNPPYVTTEECQDMDPTIRDFEPRVALDGGEDGLRCYRELLASVKGVMAPHALILLESDPRRITRVADLCVETWPGAVTHVYQDLSGRDRVLEAQVP